MPGDAERRCHGNGIEVCCFVPGAAHPEFGDGVCPLLEVDTLPDRHWVCGARRRAGSWEAAHQLPEYRQLVRPAWDAIDWPGGYPDCGDWRIDGQCCFGPANPPLRRHPPPDVALDHFRARDAHGRDMSES